MPNSPDDLEGLKAERAAADRAYNDALTQLDAAIRKLAASLPPRPPDPDVQQMASLNTLWKITTPAPEPGLQGRFAAAVRRIVAPLFEQQQAFNSAVVDHLNRNIQVGRQTQQAAAATLTVLHDTLADLVRFQSVLVMFVQQITPYVDTRDRDVAGLLRGLSGAINAVADEVLKRSETTTARAHRQDARIDALQAEVAQLRARLDGLVPRGPDRG